MGSLCEELNSGKVLVSDGAWGTFLAAAGLQPGECPELWNVERPDVVRNIAQSYIEAGADYFFDKCSEYKELEGVLKRLIRDSAPIKQTLQAD